MASAVIIVPTGRARLATSTLGPCGTGAAAACGAAAPVNMLMAASAVPIATISAPISSSSFFLSMIRNASQRSQRCGFSRIGLQWLKSGSPRRARGWKNRQIVGGEHPQPGDGDGDAVGDRQAVLAPASFVPGAECY